MVQIMSDTSYGNRGVLSQLRRGRVHEEINNTLQGFTLDQNPLPFFIIDETHRIVQWSKGCEEILGKTATEMIGTKNQWMPFYAQERPTLADLVLDQAIEEIIEGRYIDKQVRPSPSLPGAFEAVDYFPGLKREGLWLHFTAAPILDASGRMLGVIETLQDISLQHKADVQLRLANSRLEMEVAKRMVELSESNRRLKESLERAEDINHLKSVFLAAISSELKTPLNGILGFANLIRMEQENVSVNGYAGEILLSARHLERTLNDLLILSEIAAGQAELPEDQFCPREIISNMLLPYQENAVLKGLQFETEVALSCPPLMVGDAKRLIHLLGCLVDNAIKFTEQGKVVVSLEGSCNHLLLSVTDSGPGMTDEAETFFQNTGHIGRFSEPRPGGIGLGLALVKAQTELMDGMLDVVTQRGEGTRFTVAIPVKPLRQTSSSM